MTKRKKTKEDISTIYNVGDVVKRYVYRKDVKKRVVITGFVDCIKITKHKNPLIDKCYHIVWDNDTQGWWSEETLKSRNVICC